MERWSNQKRDTDLKRSITLVSLLNPGRYYTRNYYSFKPLGSVIRHWVVVNRVLFDSWGGNRTWVIKALALSSVSTNVAAHNGLQMRGIHSTSSPTCRVVASPAFSPGRQRIALRLSFHFHSIYAYHLS